MLKKTSNNYRKLIELNEVRAKNENAMIKFPVVAVTQKFTNMSAMN